jgi:general secretion pathway protein H
MKVRAARTHPRVEQPAGRTAAPHPQPGFTLIELLISIFIATLLIATVPPLFTGSISGAESRAAARQLAAALRQARSQAIARQQEAVLVLDLDQRRYRSSAARRDVQLARDFSVTLATADARVLEHSRGSIRFFPDGSSSGGRIKLSNDKRSYVVDVDWLTGKIDLHD